MITNTQSGTNIQEIAAGIYRINTPVAIPDLSGFSFNQYLIDDDEPMVFHTGLRQMFALVREAIAAVLPPARLRCVGLSHFEADECGSLNEFLTVAPNAVPICSAVAAMTSLGDFAARPPRALEDGAELALGRHRVRWFDSAHVPHAWECGLMMDMTTKTFFCGDLFTQGGPGTTALTEADILGPSEEFRKPLDYFAHAPQTGATLERFAREQPTTLAVMHGSAWRGVAARVGGGTSIEQSIGSRAEFSPSPRSIVRPNAPRITGLAARPSCAWRIDVTGSHCGRGWNPLVLWAIGDRLAQKEDDWQPFEPTGWLTYLFQ